MIFSEKSRSKTTPDSLSSVAALELLHFRIPLLLSIFFLTFFPINCTAACPEQIAERSPLDIYDEAVNLYFKPPFQKKAAFRLLEDACRCPKAKWRALSCHNLGVLHELQGERGAALSTYQRAASLQSHPWYSLAMQRNGQLPDMPPESYQFYINKILRSCQAGQGRRALSAFRSMTDKLSPDQLPGRSLLSQPFVQNCLSGQPDYAALLAKLPKPKTNPKEFNKHYYRELAKLHPLASLFDVELYLRRELNTRPSHRGVTAAWQRLLRAARRGNKPAAAKALSEMFRNLQEAARKNPALFPKVQAIKRAASVLIDRDAYFRRIRNSPAIQKQIRPFL